jgi:hypothetical protein
MEEDTDSGVGDVCNVRDQFSALRRTFPIASDCSPAPVAPTSAERENVAAIIAPHPGRVRTVDSTLHGVFRVLRMIWLQPPLRLPTLVCAVVCFAVLLVWQRSLFEASHALRRGGTHSDTPPTLLIAVAVVSRGAGSGVLLLVAHLLGWTGGVVERAVYGRRGCVEAIKIAGLQLASLTLAVFSMVRLEWRHALVFNPVTMFPPLGVLLTKFVFGSRKKWPWTGYIIAFTTAAVCIAVVADGLEPSLLATNDETVFSELGYSLTCLVSSVLFCLSMLMWEQYYYSFPTQPIYAAAFTSSMEVLLLPAVLLCDMVPGIGFAGSAQDALASFATLHRRVVDMPLSAYSLISVHTLLAVLVIPFVSRVPAMTVPIFCGLPLFAAGAFPGGAVLVIVGGAYCFFVMMFLFVDDPVYEAVNMRSLCRLVNRQVNSVAWRHGCSVIAWVPRLPVQTSDHPPSRGPSRMVVGLHLVGVAPISSSQMGVVNFSTRAFAARFSNHWRGVSYERLATANVNE